MTASLKGKGIPCEHRFLSCMAFGAYARGLSVTKLAFFTEFCVG